MDMRDKVGASLAIISLIGFLLIFTFLCFGKVDPANKDFFNIALMALVGWIGIAVGYYLGTSAGSAKKSETMAAGLSSLPTINKEVNDAKVPNPDNPLSTNGL